MDEHDRRVKRVKEAADNDPSGFNASILCAAYAEYYLKRIIASSMKGRVKKLFGDGADTHLDFMMLVRLADAMGLIEPYDADLLKALALLRNRFAHNIDHELSKEDLEKFRILFYRLFPHAGRLAGAEQGGRFRGPSPMPPTLRLGHRARGSKRRPRSRSLGSTRFVSWGRRHPRIRHHRPPRARASLRDHSHRDCPPDQVQDTSSSRSMHDSIVRSARTRISSVRPSSEKTAT
jgi:hypothetical protein